MKLVFRICLLISFLLLFLGMSMIGYGAKIDIFEIFIIGLITTITGLFLYMANGFALILDKLEEKKNG